MVEKIFGTFSVKLISAICNLLIAIIVSQNLGSFGKGEQSLILTTISLILIFENIAGGPVLVYLTSRYNSKMLIYISSAWSALTGFAFYFILKSLDIIKSDYIADVCILSVMNSYSINISNILLGKQKIRFSNIVLFSQPFFTLLTLILILYLGSDANVKIYIYSLYSAYFISLLISLILYARSNDKIILESNWKLTFKAILGLGFYNQLAHITALLNMRISYYLLEKLQSTEALGVYSNGVSLSEAIWMVSGSMAMVQYSVISNTVDKKYAQELTVKMLKISLLLTVAIIIPMLCLPSGLYSSVFGRDFKNINYILICLSPGVIFYNFSLIIGHYFSGTGKYYINTVSTLAGLVVTLILNFYAINHWGFYGAGIVSSISYMIISFCIVIFFFRESRIPFFNMFPVKADIIQYFSFLINKLKKQ